MATPLPIDLDKGGRTPQGVMTNLGPTTGWKLTDAPTDIEFCMFGTAALGVGLKGFIIVPDFVVINNWVILADTITTCIIDIWRTPLSAYLLGSPPNSTNSICGGTPPQMSAVASQGSPVGWQTQNGLVVLNQNDVLGINLSSNTAATKITLILQCVRILGNPQ
jgi:hypothetical protein